MLLWGFAALPARVRDALLLAGGLSVLLAFAAAAQQPQADAIESALAQQWQAAQTGQQNVAEALSRMIEVRRKERADAAALAEWWKRYLDGLAIGK